MRLWFLFFFFFNDTATTEIYTLSLHDALPISAQNVNRVGGAKISPAMAARAGDGDIEAAAGERTGRDRKSTRLNSSHQIISYAVFCLKKKKKDETTPTTIDNARDVPLISSTPP